MTSGAITAGSVLPTEAKVCCTNIAPRAINIGDNLNSARRLADDRPRRERVALGHSSEALFSAAVPACSLAPTATCHQTRPNLKPARERLRSGMIPHPAALRGPAVGL